MLVAPVLPMITDSDADLDRLVRLIAAAGATSATVLALHLRPGAREWFLRYLGVEHPQLVGAYAELYRGSSYVLRSYAADLRQRAARLLSRHGLDRGNAWRLGAAAPVQPMGLVRDADLTPALF